jgi:Antibiotic biosynthesis monooxygenase
MPDQPVVLINAFEVPPDDGNRFLAAWDKVREYLETQPGYIDTALHQSIIPGADFQFVNVTGCSSSATGRSPATGSARSSTTRRSTPGSAMSPPTSSATPSPPRPSTGA